MEQNWIAAERNGYAAEVDQAELEDKLAVNLKPLTIQDKSIQVAANGHEVQQWFVDQICVKRDGRYYVNVDYISVVPCFDVAVAVGALAANEIDKQNMETVVSGDNKIYALCIGTTAASLVIMPAALFYVKEITTATQAEQVDHTEVIATATETDAVDAASVVRPAAVAHARHLLPSLLLDLLEDSDVKKVVHGDAAALGERIGSDLAVDAVGFLDLRKAAKAAGEDKVALVDPKHATLQELAAAFNLEYLPKVDEGRQIFLPKLSAPAKLSELRLLGQRAIVLARLYSIMS